jgi:O-antigen ligase
VLDRQRIVQVFKLVELLGVVLTIFLLPIDRFPYLHYIPLRLGAVSLILLLVAAAARFGKIIADKRWQDFKRVVFVGFLLLLPVLGYVQSIHYAIDRKIAVGATRLLLIAALKAVCFFILIYENSRLWGVIKKTIYIVTALVVGFGFFQFIFDVLGASTKITDLRSCCTSNSTYIFPRVHSVAYEPLYLANFLTIPLWLMVIDFFQDKSARKKKYLAVLFIATSSLIVLSLARSAIFSIIIALLVFVAGLRGRKFAKKLLPYVSKTLLVIVAIAVSLVMLSGLASRYIHKTAIHGANSGAAGSVAIFGNHAVDLTDQSAQTRYSTWPKALTFIKQRPLDGVGAYNSRVELNLTAYKRGVQDIKLQPFNNDLLGLLVDLGLVGVLTFGPLVVALVVAIWRSFKLHWNTANAPYALALVAMLVQSNFFHSILLARLWVVVAIVLLGLYKLPADRRKLP